MSGITSNTAPSYVGYISSSSDVTRVYKSSESKSQNEEKTFLKYSNQDQKNIKVSEKSDENRTIKDYNIPLQPNTPAAKLLNILKSFNETAKSASINDEEDYVEFTEIDESSEEINNNASPNEIGYYVVIDEKVPPKVSKKMNRPLDMWKRRINKTYHLGFMKEPGTLVNVVA